METFHLVLALDQLRPLASSSFIQLISRMLNNLSGMVSLVRGVCKPIVIGRLIAWSRDSGMLSSARPYLLPQSRPTFSVVEHR